MDSDIILWIYYDILYTSGNFWIPNYADQKFATDETTSKEQDGTLTLTVRTPTLCADDWAARPRLNLGVTV